MALLAFSVYSLAIRPSVKLDLLLITALILAVTPVVIHAGNIDVIHFLYISAFIIAISSVWLWGAHASQPHLNIILLMFTVAAFIWCTLSIAVWVGLTDGERVRIGLWTLTTVIQSKINGPFSNGNVLGILAFCAWATALWFWINEKKRSGKVVWLVLLTFFWAVGLSTLSRGAWVAHLIVLLITILHLFQQKRKFDIVKICISFLVAVILFYGIDTSSIDTYNLFPVERQIETTVQLDSGRRKLLWLTAFEIWNQHPIAGVGYGNFSAHFLTAQANTLPALDFKYYGFEFVTNAHNIFLHLSAEAGIFGMALVLLITGLLSVLVLQNRNHINSPVWPATMMAGMLWLQGMSNITMAKPFPILLFAFVLGVATSPLLKKYSLQKHSISLKTILLPTLLSIIILAGWGINQTRAWIEYEEWITTEGDPEKSKSLAISLIQTPDMLPFVVAHTMLDVIHKPEHHQHAVPMLPLIHEAIQQKQMIILYQGLFFAQVSNHDLSGACQTGQFIKKQHWMRDMNNDFYDAACNNTLNPDTFQIENHIP